MESRPWQRHYDYKVPTTIRYPRISVPELLGLPANAVADKPAFIFHGTELSFYQLRQLVLRMANALGELGVRKGDRVGLQLPTSPQYTIAYYAVLYQHPKILDAVAVGVDDEYRGETVKAFVVLREGETATDKEIIGFCREKLAAYKAPKLVEFRDELPKSAVGKVLRKILREEEEAKKKAKKE